MPPTWDFPIGATIKSLFAGNPKTSEDEFLSLYAYYFSTF